MAKLTRPKTPEPWHPAEYDDSIRANVKALWLDPTYKIACDWILFDLCRLGDLSFRADSIRTTDFAEGKRFVALQIAKMVKMRTAKQGEQP